MSDQYKFEMIRFDDSAQINTSHSVKTRLVTCKDVVYTFAEFLWACGFERKTVLAAYKSVEDELSGLR